MVECFLAKEDVAGSTPVSRSNNLISTTYGSKFLLHTTVRCVSECGFGAVYLPRARYPSGKGEVCKTFMRRFDPDPRLQNFPQSVFDSTAMILLQRRGVA